MAAGYFDTLDPADRGRFLAAPSSTGRKRWDTLLAKAFAFKCHQHEVKAPMWTEAPPLTSRWYATPRKNVSAAGSNAWPSGPLSSSLRPTLFSTPATLAAV
jgi:hypothetical protein